MCFKTQGVSLLAGVCSFVSGSKAPVDENQNIRFKARGGSLLAGM